MTDNEFSPAFSAAFDPAAVVPPVVPPVVPSEPELAPLPNACWYVDWGCADQEWLAQLDPNVRERSEAMATQVLRSLTGHQIGGCPITVRPCAKGCTGGSYFQAPVAPGVHSAALGVRVGPWWASIDVDGQWINTWCACTTSCSCTSVSEVWLPAPVGGVVRVVIDDLVLDPVDYRVDNGNRLVRLDGLAWPKCQDMNAAVGADGAFAVTYYNNFRPDGLASWIAGIMAYEFAKSCTGGKCRLPSGVQSISRLGISMEIPSGMFADGLTGIREVDAWLRTWNPYQLRSPSQVWSPDMATTRRTTSWPVFP